MTSLTSNPNLASAQRRAQALRELQPGLYSQYEREIVAQADEIERLTRERNRQEEVTASRLEELHGIARERDRLKMERDDWHKVADDRAAEIVRLTGMLSGEPEQPDETGKEPAIALLEKELQADRAYAWSWHCNIAVPIMDQLGCSHESANRSAAELMRHLFHVDVTAFPEWKTFQWNQDKCECGCCLPPPGEVCAGCGKRASEKASEQCPGCAAGWPRRDGAPWLHDSPQGERLCEDIKAIESASEKAPETFDVREANRKLCAAEGHVLSGPVRPCLRCHEWFDPHYGSPLNGEANPT